MLLMAAAPLAGAAPADDALIERGEYIYRAGGCAGCHTDEKGGGAENAGGVAIETAFGVFYGPNITPDRQTGIGRWSASDLAYYLETGLRPDGDSAGSLMADVIDNGLRYLTKEDLNAIAAYVFSLPPVENAVREQKQRRDEYDF